MNRAEFIDANRREAWALGRAIRDDLLSKYCVKYHKDTPPPPATIVNELLTEFLGVELEFVPMNLNVFAETEWFPHVTVVRVNSRTREIHGVKDALGVQAVAEWHEGIHVLEHAPGSNGQQQLLLDLEHPRVTCRRGKPSDFSSTQAAREFLAEEAGRAAAVSFFHLWRSAAFQELMGNHPCLPNRERWDLLYQAADDIGINSSALVRQLQLEGYIGIDHVSERRVLRVQPTLGKAD